MRRPAFEPCKRVFDFGVAGGRSCLGGDGRLISGLLAGEAILVRRAFAFVLTGMNCFRRRVKVAVRKIRKMQDALYRTFPGQQRNCPMGRADHDLARRIYLL